LDLRRNDAPLLALDTGSPTVSVAIGRDRTILALRQREIERSSEGLIGMIDEALAKADMRLSELAGIAVLRGPGSFTGLRVGLATVIGLRQALGLPATAVPTLAAIAAAAQLAGRRGRVACVVNALRDHWFVQEHDLETIPAISLHAPERRHRDALSSSPVGTIAGFGASSLADLGLPSREVWEPPPLAPAAIFLASAPSWRWRTEDGVEDPLEPLYLSAPAVTVPASGTSRSPW
jgi:tRNA threonylcarbamoyl adenosine modification protein YeaZ